MMPGLVSTRQFLARDARTPDTPAVHMQTPVRAIVGRFSYSVSRGAIEGVLRAHPWEFCASITPAGVPKFFTGLPEAKQQWFDSVLLRGCDYGDVVWDMLAPLDEELLERLRECESVFMEMVARLEWKKSVPYGQRKHWYYRHVRFWNDYLDRHGINLYISAWIPHEIPDIVIYHLCKLKKIPVLYFRDATERDTSFAEHDIAASAECIAPRYAALLKDFGHINNPEDIALTPEYERRFAVLSSSVGEKPAIESVKFKTYGQRIRIMLVAKPLEFLWFALGYLTLEGLLRIRYTIKRRRIFKERNAFYNAHAKDPDLTKPYIFLALHFQPEASTLPMGGAYIDQFLVAEMIHAQLPKGTLLYIKEHPRESGWLNRNVEYYKRLTALPNVRFVPRSFDSFLLREHCKAVATITGSVGYEALFRGKPVLMFGHCFYQYAKGVLHICTVEDCKKAMHEIFVNGFAPTGVGMRLFLKAMEDTRVNGLFNPWTLKVSQLTELQHIENNTNGILHELRVLEPQIRAANA